MRPLHHLICFVARTLAVGTALATLVTQAHSVWIEPTPDGGLALRFAEPDGKFETSPGHLDELSAIAAFSGITNGAPTAIEAVKKKDHFLLVGASSTNAAGAEATYVVMALAGKAGRKPVFYARWQPSGAPIPAPGLNLDLVPTGKSGEVRAYLRGKPLAGVAAILRFPDEREREITADAEGLLRFNSDQRGLHQIRIARHRETSAGFHLGREHDVISHNACLAWIQP